MFKCPLCDKQYESKRQLHGHMLKAHQEEYRKYGNRVANIVLEKGGEKPAGLRLLDIRSECDRVAYAEGYRYRDRDYYYTADEVKEKGWV